MWVSRQKKALLTIVRHHLTQNKVGSKDFANFSNSVSFFIAAGAFFLLLIDLRSLSNDLFGDVICWTESIQDEPPNASNKSRQPDTSRIDTHYHY